MPPRYSRRAITALLHQIDAHERGWDRFFDGRPQPLELSYEAVVRDLSGSASRVLRALGVHARVDLPVAPMQPQADELTLRWRRRYLEEA